MQESQAMIFVRNHRNPKWTGKYGRVARYAAIHHRSPRGREYFMRGPILSGDPKWLFTVQREIRKRFGTKVRGHIQTFIKEGKSGPIERWIPDFQRRVNRLQKRVGKEPVAQAQWGVQVARKIAPNKDGYLMQAIDYKKLKTR